MHAENPGCIERGDPERTPVTGTTRGPGVDEASEQPVAMRTLGILRVPTPDGAPPRGCLGRHMYESEFGEPKQATVIRYGV